MKALSLQLRHLIKIQNAGEINWTVRTKLPLVLSIFPATCFTFVNNVVGKKIVNPIENVNYFDDMGSK